MKYEFRFPDIGEGIREGTLMKWLVHEGEDIEEGQSLAEVETDKVTTEIPSPRTGKVLELKFEEGDTIEVEQVFITISIGGESENSQAPEEQEVVEEETAGVVGEVIASSELIPASTEGMITSSKESDEAKKVLATPVARQLAKDLNVDIRTVQGTGPNGRVMKEDINKTKETSQPIQQVKAAEISSDSIVYSDSERIERIPLTRIRKTIAEQMVVSRFTIPHTTAMDEIDVTALDEFRNKYKDRLKTEDVNLTYLPFIIKAVINILKEYPEFNSSYDMENQELLLKHFYHIGIATDTDRGLMVPVLRDADKKSIVHIAKEIEDLTSRAKNNKSELHELKGSTFTITNFGSIGGLFGIPIINYPESAILGMGRIVKKPIVKDDEIVIAKVLPLSLSYDHRIIDGASGARFLNLLSQLLSDPEILLMKS
ncbi:dihydrolipoamide acetyltransferase family protein [Tissierella sp.]|uniref:dihydrolipoamide acetyltransferase family protein n=1 Tax=Tissierella sp. TaxID=41274 RepID=UPI00285A422A|nr:dihydrolipoamide acetyltransferase family protein [Tissierella sp.]MDR7855464.1 dihydrolipoamide acetyltransferase family protein [Tissierella sp.]